MYIITVDPREVQKLIGQYESIIRPPTVRIDDVKGVALGPWTEGTRRSQCRLAQRRAVDIKIGQDETRSTPRASPIDYSSTQPAPRRAFRNSDFMT